MKEKRNELEREGKRSLSRVFFEFSDLLWTLRKNIKQLRKMEINGEYVGVMEHFILNTQAEV